MNYAENQLAKTWRRIGLTEVWGIPLLWFTIIVTAILSLAFDAVRLDNYTPLWFPINVIAFLCGVAVVLVGWYLAKRIVQNEMARPFWNLFIAGMAMGTKNAVTAYLCGVFGIETGLDLLFRFAGGSFIGICLLLIYSNVVGANREHSVIQKELFEKEQALIGFRENISDSFAEEEEELRSRTAAELLPRLEALNDQVKLSSESNLIHEQLHNFLVNEVKPISASLANEATKLSRSIPERNYTLVADPGVKIDFSDSIRPIASAFSLLVTFWVMCTVVLPVIKTNDIVIVSVIFGVILTILKYAFKPFKQVKAKTVIYLTALPGFISAIPGYILLMLIPHNSIENSMIPVFLVISSWISVVFGQAYVLEQGRNAAEEKLRAAVSQFERENKLFEQRLWIAQRVWYTLLHGTVQSAITAASIRANTSDSLSSADRDAIARDLNRAADALRNPTQDRITMAESMAALSSTWEDIAQIHLEADETLIKQIDTNQDSAMVVNEILKEAISNAIHHGQAKDVQVRLRLASAGILEILVSNDGVKPKETRGDGVGTKIFEVLCIERSLSWKSSENRTEFLATIPLA